MANALGAPGRLHVAGNVGCWSMEELHFVLQLERYGITHHAMDKIDKSGIPPEDGGEEAIVAFQHNDLARRNELFIFPGEVSDGNLVRH